MEAEEAHDGHKCGSTEDDVEKMAVMNGAMRCKVASIVGEERKIISMIGDTRIKPGLPLMLGACNLH